MAIGAATSIFLSAVTSYALSVITNKLFGKKAQSPTYTFSALQTQCSNALPIPMVYGTVKMAGNCIWSSKEGEKTQDKLVSFGLGPIKNIKAVCFNDLLAVDGAVMRVWNTKWSDAHIQVSSHHLFLTTNSTTTEYKLKDDGVYNSSGTRIYTDYTVGVIATLLADLDDGWETDNVISSSNVIDEINGLSITACYNSPVELTVDGLDDCSYTVYTGNGTQTIDDRVPGDTQEEKAKVVGGLRHEAYLAISAKASDKLSGDYNVTALVEGRLVNVYSDASTYTTGYSENPIWCTLDFLMSDNGCGIEASGMDITGLITEAAYCDVEVDDQPRFTLNYALDEKKSRQDWLDDMLFCFRAYRTYQRGLHGIYIEKAADVAQVFDIAADETIEFWWSDINEEIERLRLIYCDPDYEWAKVEARAEASSFRGRIPTEKQIEMYGVTNFKQASRNAWFYLNQAQDCKMWMKYTCNRRAMNRTICDVIQTNDPVLELTDKLWRIFSISESQDGKIAMTCREYNADLYGDTMAAVAPTINVTKLTGAATVPPAVASVSLSEVGWMNKDGVHVTNIDVTCSTVNFSQSVTYLVMYSSDSGSTWKTAGYATEFPYRISGVATAVAYMVGVQTVTKAGLCSARTTASITTVGKDAAPSNVSTLSAALEATDLSKVDLSWSPISDSDLAGYRIREGTTIVENLAQITTYTYKAIESRAHTFSVAAVDNSGNESSTPVTATVTPTIYPATPSGFTAVQNGEYAYLYWVKNSATDIAGYEVRQGAIFNSGVLVQTGITGTDLSVPVSTEITYRFHIKAINNAGNYSVEAATAEVTITNLEPKNVILTYDEMTLQSGTHTNTVFGSSFYTCLTFPGYCSDYPTTKCNEVGGSTVLKLQDGYTSGEYLAARKDLGALTKINLAADFISTALLSAANSATLKYRHSRDGTNYDEWKVFTPTTMTTWYLDFKAVLESSDQTNYPIEVGTFAESVDVDDVEKTGTATIAAGGTTVSYGWTFIGGTGPNSMPIFTPTAIGSGLRAEVVSVGLSSAVVRVIQCSDNTDVGGTITWTTKGYGGGTTT